MFFFKNKSLPFSYVHWKDLRTVMPSKNEHTQSLDFGFQLPSSLQGIRIH